MKQILCFLSTLLLLTSARAQQGTLEYKLTIASGPRTQSTSNTVYFSNGNVRTEVAIPLPGAAKPLKQTMLLLASKPNVLYGLNESSRTYTETSLNAADKASPGKATVKVVGKEKIQNLNCTHVVVTLDKSALDLWTTKDIAGYEKLTAYWRMQNSFGGGDLYGEMKKKGADGFIVRMKNAVGQGGITMDLVRHDAKPVAASLFEVPKGYKKSTGFDPAMIQNLPPAQRQQLMEQMMKQYGVKQ